MTTLIISVAALVTVASAVRSTWSPCGLSMLASITPLSETGRGNRFRTTASWFVVGSTAGGLTLGVCVGVLAVGVHGLALSSTAVGVAALATAVVAAASDTGVKGFRVPVHHRQVNERWLDQFRPWAYAAGFGWQIGTGLATYITTAAVYLVIVLGALGGSPAWALALGLGFGLVRGLSVLLGRNIARPRGPPGLPSQVRRRRSEGQPRHRARRGGGRRRGGVDVVTDDRAPRDRRTLRFRGHRDATEGDGGQRAAGPWVRRASTGAGSATPASQRVVVQ